jgi:hypothetical protein
MARGNTLAEVREIADLPLIVPRTMAARFARLNPRTLDRAEERGELRPIKRNSRVICYRREEFLAWLGLREPKPETVGDPA